MIIWIQLCELGNPTEFFQKEKMNTNGLLLHSDNAFSFFIYPILEETELFK